MEPRASLKLSLYIYFDSILVLKYARTKHLINKYTK